MIVGAGVRLLGLLIGPDAVAKLILTAAILPLVLGMIVRTLMPVVAEKIAKPVSPAAKILLPSPAFQSSGPAHMRSSRSSATVRS